ncbi:MAG: hypothetical protein K2M78_13525 [Lachnospiraceae bacterium]|nr:hypothetical protein [Lachnospiraceae bacterium]
MAGYITYWPKEQIRNLEREKDKGPITVIFGSIHTKMPSIKSVKVGDIIYPVTLVNNSLYVVAKMPVEQIETAYEYLIRELGNRCGALPPEGINQNEYYNTPIRPHKCHQMPFNCCSETAAKSEHGTTIKLRPIPLDKIKELRFGSTKSKQKPLRIDKNGNPSILSVSSCVRKMSDETKIIFDSVFEEDSNIL